MTRTESFGQDRRRSRAASHRSRASINSDNATVAVYADEEPTDDSGIGGELHGTQQLLQIPTSTHEYGSREPYHDIQDYPPEGYYRGYGAG